MRQTLTRILLGLTLFTTQHYAESYQTQDLSVPLFPNEPREGWFGGIGAGVHTTSLDFNSYKDVDSASGFVTSLKAGYNFTEQLGVQYIRNASWYTLSDDLHASGITGLGVTYYLEPLNETAYVTLALGLGDWANIDGEASELGSAFMATVGYEFSPHWQAEASWMMTSIEDNYNNTLDSSSLQILLNYSWY